MNKKCVWCNKSDNETTFNKEAHTIPKSLGGKNICKDVCDICNEYFGNRNNYDLPIEIALKETFNPTRFLLHHSIGMYGKGKSMPRFKSEIFDLNIEKKIISYKRKFKTDENYQIKFIRLLKRGIYKIFIEEIQRQKESGFDKTFYDIKSFARNDIGDFPVFYWKLKPGFLSSTFDEIMNPQLYFGEFQNIMINEIGFYEFMLFGHLFGIPLTMDYQTNLDKYLNWHIKSRKTLYSEIKVLKSINDIDIFLNGVNI